MYDIVCDYLIELSNILIPAIFLRMVLDCFRNFVFKN